ncbi:hypothetical protein JD844_024229 [Phrynosoma platyrhinos]|uniref:SPATA31 domain-containing protein n=1 Tax=Phrynosoma platyrhinos TaxID=52577 RepID=A0ABQ7SXI7_PHRPL|nr:hypothetical protein JD844_024229 [Phrynosoma platyrhinos]
MAVKRDHGDICDAHWNPAKALHMPLQIVLAGSVPWLKHLIGFGYKYGGDYAVQALFSSLGIRLRTGQECYPDTSFLCNVETPGRLSCLEIPVHQGRVERQQETIAHGKGVPQKLSVSKNQIGPYTGSIRELLCDDPMCVVCDKVANEVMEWSYFQRRYSQGPMKPKIIRKMQEISLRPTTPGIIDSKTTLCFRGNLQDHIMKKSIGMRLEGFPVVVEHPQRMTDTEQRNTHLPKLIPLGQSYPQLRNRLCLSLQGKGDIIEINIRCKQVHFLWGLPSIHMQSQSRLVPSPPVSSAALLSQACICVEFDHAETPFIAPEERKILESHVLKKRLQHSWGLLGLVQQSLKQFLLPVPASSAHLTTTPGAQFEVQVVISCCQIPFAPLRTMEHLETHLRMKIVESWRGQTRRVLESLESVLSSTHQELTRE